MQRIILADNQAIFRTGVARVLAMEADFRIVAQCSSAVDLKKHVEELRNATIIFSSSFCEDVEDLVARIEAAGSRAVVIIEHGTELESSVAARAHGLMRRSVTGPDLVHCLRQVAQGNRCVQDAKTQQAETPDRVGARVLARLTPKEMQIVALVTEGAKNREIALKLETKEQVIKNYLRSIYDKTGVSDRLELALFTAHHRALAESVRRVRQELGYTG